MDPIGASSPVRDLEQRDLSVLEEIGRDQDARVAFQGLRRRLLLHQEILSRALRRLQRYGLVQRAAGGYQLTPRGAEFLEGRTGSPAEPVLRTILEASLPPSLSPVAVANRLANRWFDGLRWYGRSDRDDGLLLTWLTEPERRPVRLRVTREGVALEVEDLPGDPRRFAAARPVLAAMAELYGIMPEGNGASAALVARPAFAA